MVDVICKLKELVFCKKEPKKPDGFRWYCPHCKAYIKPDNDHEIVGTDIERWFFGQKNDLHINPNSLKKKF